MNQDIGTEKNNQLLERLRSAAKNGKTVRELAQIVQGHYGPEEWTNFSIMSYFREAFNVSFHQVKKISGAVFMNGGLYTDEEIDQIIRPHIEEHFLNKRDEGHDIK